MFTFSSLTISHRPRLIPDLPRVKQKRKKRKKKEREPVNRKSYARTTPCKWRCATAAVGSWTEKEAKDASLFHWVASRVSRLLLCSQPFRLCLGPRRSVSHQLSNHAGLFGFSLLCILFLAPRYSATNWLPLKGPGRGIYARERASERERESA